MQRERSGSLPVGAFLPTGRAPREGAHGNVAFRPRMRYGLSMGPWLILLLIPALALWMAVTADVLRTPRHVTHDRNYATRPAPPIRLPGWMSGTKRTRRNQAEVFRARRIRRWFLIYCIFLFVVLLTFPRAEAGVLLSFGA